MGRMLIGLNAGVSRGSMLIRPRQRYVPALVALLACLNLAAAQTKVIYEKVSPFNTIVVTDQQDGLRTLQFERSGPRQSVVKLGDPDHVELPYARAMLTALALIDEPERILVIGLGGGTLPTFLAKHYPQTAIDAVDIDPDVVDVARKFFGFREDATLRAHVADGRKFIEKCDRPYDMILLDAYGSDNIPRHLATREFLLAVRRALRPTGVAVANVWSRGSNPLYDSMLRTYRDVFDRVQVLDVPGSGNIIFFAFPRQVELRRNDFVRRAESISRKKQFPFDLGNLVRRGLQPATAGSGPGQVLTDPPE